MKTLFTLVSCCMTVVFMIPLATKEKYSSEDYVLVDLSNVIKDNSRHKRETTTDEPCSLPTTLDLPITYKNNTEVLHLTRDDIKSPEKIPLYELGPDGNLIVMPKKKVDRGSALYYYYKLNHRHGIMLTCDYLALCTATCEIKGSLITTEEYIEILGSALEKVEESQKSVPHDISIQTIPDTQFEGSGDIEGKKPGLNRYGEKDDNAPPVRTITKRTRSPEWRRRRRLRKKYRERLAGLLSSKLTIRKRRKRDASSWYQENEDILELLMINDDRLLTRFKYWGEKQYTEEEAVILMVEYMAYIASGIDHRMYNIRKKASDIRLRVHLSGVLVIKDNKGLNWTNSIVYLDDDPSKPYLDADSAIGNLSRFVYNDPSAFSKFDHVMALTGQNIALWVPSTDTDYWEKGVLGYAYSGSMCTNPYYSVSVVEVPGLGNPARIATHEIAHTMSTGHDTKNGCRTADQYIMAEQVLPTTSENRRHPFEFSNCSIENIRDYLHGLNRFAVNPDYSENIGNCLKHHQAEKVFDNTEDKRFMGERFSYDEECKFLMDDPSAYACYIPNQSYCYGYMYCYWPSVDPLYQFCYAGCPYDGSPCNGTDVCYEGTCVPKSEALAEIPDTEALKQQEEIDASQ